jgi:hypothetical protein
VFTVQGRGSATTFNLDIDGDGAFTFNDSIIHARIAFGFTGAAVVNGLTFGFGATRTTWTDIRNYLVSQCGATLPP